MAKVSRLASRRYADVDGVEQAIADDCLGVVLKGVGSSSARLAFFELHFHFFNGLCDCLASASPIVTIVQIPDDVYISYTDFERRLWLLELVR